MSETNTTEPFAAEVGRLLDLVVHSLYSEREIFLRELVANAADAIDRRRFESLSDAALALPESPAIRISTEREGRVLRIADDGIGMDREELARNLGTIARSGTRMFGESLVAAKPEERPALIGQFGVGFYSAFMVAERVEVISRKAGTEAAWAWRSDGVGGFSLAPAERETAGSEVVLHLRADATEFLDAARIEAIVRKWADHVTVPILLARDGKEVPINAGTALWRRPRADLSAAERNSFYRHLGNLFDEPWTCLHWRAEGAVEFWALLYIPGSRPLVPVEDERRAHLRLHVKRMFITAEAALTPDWMRFVQGVVDTEDLPLNVSREMLQSTPVIARIRKAVTGKVLAELRARSADAAEYAKFWENFGTLLKEGVWEDHDLRDEIAPLLRFRSSAVEGWTSLGEYVARMKPEQAAIYFLAGEHAEALRNSPQIEGFRARGFEVLLGDDPIDAFWPDRLDRFEGKPIRRAGQAGADVAGQAAEVGKDEALLIAAFRSALGTVVSDVRLSARLTESAVMLAPAEKGPDLHMQRLLARAGRSGMGAAPVLELNPGHAVIRRLAAALGQGQPVTEAAEMLFDLARIQEGEAPREPASFARRVSALLGGEGGN